MPTAQAILKRIAIVALTLGASASASSELADIPEEILEDLLAPDTLSSVDDGDRERLLQVLARDPRPSIRQSAATGLATLRAPLTPELHSTLARLATDRARTVRQALASALGPLLAELPALDRAWLVDSWATAESSHQRWAIATALAWPFDVLGARTALAHLAADASPEVRAAAARARRGRYG